MNTSGPEIDYLFRKNGEPDMRYAANRLMFPRFPFVATMKDMEKARAIVLARQENGSP